MNMDISSVSLDSYLISSAVNLKSTGVQNEITLAVMKQSQDSQEAVANALIEMMSQPLPRVDGTGTIINLAA